MFIPECHVDTALARVLLAGRLTFVNHQHGISQVAHALQAQAEADRGPRFVVGLVDQDKQFAQNKYLCQFNELFASRTSPDCRYRIYRHPQHTTHFLIVLDPACDTWIFEAAQAARLDLDIFGLPSALPGFIAFAKQKGVETSPSFKKLMQAIEQAQPAAYRELAEFVADIMDQNSRLWRQL